MADLIDLIFLLEDCPQSGQYIQVKSIDLQNMVQGCVDDEKDPLHPKIKIVNPRSFFYEIRPISGGNNYPEPRMLGPGDTISFEVNRNDPSPLIVSGEITQAAGERLMLYVILSAMPGMTDLNKKVDELYCLAEQTYSTSFLGEAWNSVVTTQYQQANEFLGRFIADTDSMTKFVAKAISCNFNIAKTWPVKLISKQTTLFAIDISLWDYWWTNVEQIRNQQFSSKIAFYWTSPDVAVAKPDGKVYLGERVILDTAQDAPGCFDVGEISYSPSSQNFLVVMQCFELDNDAFLFSADGSQKRRVTGEWDYINGYDYEWAPDGQSFVYHRINSCCAPVPSDAPPAGLVRYDIQTGNKTLVAADTPSPELYYVVNVKADDVLNIRSGPGTKNSIVGTIPPNGVGIIVTGTGVQVDNATWVPIIYNGITGWVNNWYLAIQITP